MKFLQEDSWKRGLEGMLSMFEKKYPVRNKMECHVIRSMQQRGFVLITVLALLSLLTILSVSLYFISQSTQQDSAVARKSTQGAYYAETALSYMQWSWANDADFDSAIAPGDQVALGKTTGDREEWLASSINPGPTTKTGTNGAVMYFDNTPLATRTIAGPAANPVMYHISASLPRYVRIDIASNGNIAWAVPSMPHPAVPVPGVDVPVNGAVVWLTAGSLANVSAGVADKDYALTTPCAPTSPANGCDASTGLPVQYRVIGYAIGYVDGLPTTLIRSVIR